MPRTGIYAYEHLVEEGTRRLLAEGHTIFQAHLLGSNELDHCVALRRVLPVPDGATILDIGSGVGGIPDLMPQFKWTLLNISEVQLRLSNSRHVRVCGDMDALPFKTQTFDAALMCYCLGHTYRVNQAILEALRCAGVVVIHDIAAEDPTLWKKHLRYTPLNLGKMIRQWGWPKYMLQFKDGGLFEKAYPGMWAATGATEIIMVLQVRP